MRESHRSQNTSPRAEEHVSALSQEAVTPDFFEEKELAEFFDMLNAAFDKVNTHSRREQVEAPLPQLSFDIFYSYHRSAKDAEAMQKLFADADIYAPEATGWNEEVLAAFRRVSTGRVYPKEVLREYGWDVPTYEFMGQVLAMIHGSNKPITFLDVPDSDPSVENLKLLNLEEIGLFSLLSKRPFAVSIRNIKVLLRQYADTNERRESVITSSEHIEQVMRETLKRYPILKSKEKLHMLISFGAQHTPMVHALRKRGEKIQRHIPSHTMVFPLQLEGIRRYSFGKEVDDLLAARILFEGRLYTTMQQHFFSLTKDTQKIFLFLRKAITQFTLEEIAELLTAQYLNREEEDRAIASALKKKGFAIPQSEKELNNIL